MHLGRLPEAEAALTAALEKYPDDAELIANTIVLNVLAGKPSVDLESYVFAHLGLGTVANPHHSRLQQVKPSHPLLSDIHEKSEFFDTAAAKYSPKVTS